MGLCQNGMREGGDCVVGKFVRAKRFCGEHLTEDVVGGYAHVNIRRTRLACRSLPTYRFAGWFGTLNERQITEMELTSIRIAEYENK